MVLSAVADTHYDCLSILVRVIQVPPVAQSLQQGEKAGVGLTGSSKYSRSNGIH